MKKINVYVVTYNNVENINNNITRFCNTTKDVKPEEFDINYHIINNHSNFNIKEENKYRKITIFHNMLRSDLSCGHLSRDYNAAIMHGFKDLAAPACDQVICVHDDTMWAENWFDRLQKIHETYSFYSGDFGCSMTSYLPEAVKKIGLWDERFCNIAYHEADYFLRALIYNKEKSSINDHFGGRTLNVTENLFDRIGPNGDKHAHVSGSQPYHAVSRAVFAEKWAVHPEFWKFRNNTDEPGIDLPKKSLIPNYVYYPYFEKEIEDLTEKNYTFELNFKTEWHEGK